MRRGAALAVAVDPPARGLRLALRARGQRGDTAISRGGWFATRARPARLYASPADVDGALLGARCARRPGGLDSAEPAGLSDRAEGPPLLLRALVPWLALHRARRALGDRRSTWAGARLVFAGDLPRPGIHPGGLGAATVCGLCVLSPLSALARALAPRYRPRL